MKSYTILKLYRKDTLQLQTPTVRLYIWKKIFSDINQMFHVFQ